MIPTPQKAILSDAGFPAGNVAIVLAKDHPTAHTVVVIGRAGAHQVAGELFKRQALTAEMSLAAATRTGARMHRDSP